MTKLRYCQVSMEELTIGRWFCVNILSEDDMSVVKIELTPMNLNLSKSLNDYHTFKSIVYNH